MGFYIFSRHGTFKSCSRMESSLFQLFLRTLQLLKFNVKNSLGTFTFNNKPFYVLTEDPKIRRNHLQVDNSCYNIKTVIGIPQQIIGYFSHRLKDVIIFTIFRKRTIYKKRIAHQQKLSMYADTNTCLLKQVASQEDRMTWWLC